MEDADSSDEFCRFLHACVPSVQAALGYKRPGTRTNPRNQLPSLEDREA